IIRDTPLAAGTFYNYFKSKEEVFEALAVDSTTRFRPILAEVRSSAVDLETYIRAAYRAYFTFLSDENAEAIKLGTPHMALIGVRVDTPEMKAVVAEIRADLEARFDEAATGKVDTEYITAAAVGIAREMGDYMLKRRPVDVEAASATAADLFLSGVTSLGIQSKL
ncbi:MAG: TetR/AcrR family transcriptional regulator, partial [Pseudomonadota bacterium]